MTSKVERKDRNTELLLKQLVRNSDLRQQAARDSDNSGWRMLLAQWQAHRLARTYSDLLVTPRYKLAVDFFLSDLYGAKDFSQRDYDLERVYPIMVKLLPAHVLYTVALAVEVNVLTQELDTKLLNALLDDLGSGDELSEELYARAYRQCDNYTQRKYQIELIWTIGNDMDSFANRPFIHTALRLCRRPARLAGLGDLQNFLEHGLEAFQRMDGADDFLGTIVERETLILDRIYAGHPTPFDIPRDMPRDIPKA